MSGGEYRFGDYRLVASARELWQGETLLILPRRVFDCLLYLLERRERAVGRDELAAAVWGRVDVSDGQIGQLVMRVRRTLGDDGQAQNAIRTIPGYGYRWILPVSEADVAASPDAGMDAMPVADEAVAAEPPSTPPAGAAPAQPRARGIRQWRLAWAILLLLLIAPALYFATTRLRGTPDDAADGNVIVLPVLVDDADADSAWIRLGLMDLIAERLRSADLPVPQSEHALALLAQLPPADVQADAQAQLQALPATADIGRVVQGRAEHGDRSWRITLDAAGRDGARYRQSAEHADVLTAARLAADRLLAALGRSPPRTEQIEPALEERLQRAQAALLANELDTARAILLADGAQAAQDPEVRLRLAQIDYRAGHLDAARTALDALIDGADAAADQRVRSRALRSRGTLHIRLGDDLAAERDFDAAADLLSDQDGAPAELGWALNGRGVARMILDRPDEAAADLGRARVHLERAGEVRGVISVDNNLGLLELTRLRPAQAIAHSGAAALRFEALGAVNEALSAQSVAIEAHLAQLDWREALAVNDRGWALRDRVEDPDVLLPLVSNRARILIGLGRLNEAAGLLDEIESAHRDIQDWNRAELYAALTELAWERGDYAAAIGEADRALALASSSTREGRPERIALLRLRSRARLGGAAGAPEAAAAALGGRAPSPYLLLAQAERATAAASDAARAEAAYRQALALAETRGLPAEIAWVASSYGRWLLTTGRGEDATAVIGRIAPWAERDFDCALMQVALFHQRGERAAWARALEQARQLAGEREIPPRWRTPPG